MKHSRRDFLKTSGLTGLSAAAISLFPPSIQRALAIPANNRKGTIEDVEHVVILMQENRSFNHYFGTMKGVRGFGDRFTIPQPDGRSVWEQLDKKNKAVLPYHLDQNKGNAQRVKGTPHTWIDARDAWGKGRITHWPAFKKPQSMGYYGREEIPFQFALAEAFTLCDAYYCSLHGGTTSNRLFFWTGTNGATAKPPQVLVNNFWYFLEPGMKDGGFRWKTYPERLEEAGISWKIYQNMPDNFGCNVLAGFDPFRRANIASGQPVYNSDDEHYKARAYDPVINAKVPLYKGIANTMPDGGFLGTFREDIQNGKLPAVSWLVSPTAYSEHPGTSSPVQGAWYAQQVLDALTENPEVWSKTVFLLTFDENDGFFDHMPPPCAPSKINDRLHGKATLSSEALQYEYYDQPPVQEFTKSPPPDGDVYGPGPRVPMYVISPWSRGGWINSQNFDHTSVLRFLEARFGVQETNISVYRRKIFGDLTSAFNFKSPNLEKLPQLAGRQSKDNADHLRAKQEQLPQIKADGQTLPAQEPGYKPSRALPYVLHTHASASASEVELNFVNDGQMAALFHVYDKLNLDAPPRRYAVETQQSLQDQWEPAADGSYDLWVLSSNGFHRHVCGNVNNDAAASCTAAYKLPQGDLLLTFENHGEAPVYFIVTCTVYPSDTPLKRFKVNPGAKRELTWKARQSGRWYDLDVQLEGHSSWRRRFAGRIENGQDSITDPAMGTATPAAS